MERDPITKIQIDNAFKMARYFYDKRVEEKGSGGFTSLHELYGFLKEEVDEFFDEVKTKGDGASAELLDVAVAAIWGIAGHMPLKELVKLDTENKWALHCGDHKEEE